MAEVFRAKAEGIAGFEKPVALKRIKPALAREPRFVHWFVNEARIAASLSHRNVVQVFDFGRAEGELYLAMELIDGVDLGAAIRAARARGTPPSVALACQILADVAVGLDYAHGRCDAGGRTLGIVHADVSPRNVMVAFEGYVKLLDFGIGRARFTAAPEEGRLCGTPQYMAPERARLEPPTPAADVFALAALAWELFAGMRLFEGSSVGDVLAAVRRAQVPPIESINPSVPDGLGAILARALDRDPARRPTAADLGAAFAAARRAVDPAATAVAVRTWLEQVYFDPGEPAVADLTEPTTAVASPRARAAATARRAHPK
jgi:serine/threonine-protein kinase